MIEQARNTAASSSETISSSIGALEAKRNEASNNGDEETANALQSSIDALYAAKDATDGVSNNLQTLTGVDPSQLPSIDTEAIQQNIDVITSEAGKLQTALPQLQAAIPELEKQLQSIEAAEGSCTGRSVEDTDRQRRSVGCRNAGTELSNRYTSQQSCSTEQRNIHSVPGCNAGNLRSESGIRTAWILQ